jgi:nitrogen-specific signal transduction histidine kinase
MSGSTSFTSPDRSSGEETRAGHELLREETTFLDFLGAASGITAILDRNRQIVYGNKELLDLLGFASVEELLGKRPGEAISCINASSGYSGCGTSEACSVCGAVNAIIESEELGVRTEKETRITSLKNGNIMCWDFKVISAPVEIRNKRFYVFSIKDNSDEKRWQNLERIFYHDILNSAAGLNGLLLSLRDGKDISDYREIIKISEEVSRELIEEILIHRQIRAAETGDLVINREKLVASEILKSVVARISGNESSKAKNIIISDLADGSEIVTDRLIIQRILINMLKNAVEATGEGGTVKAIVEEDKNRIRFIVKNDYPMPKEIQMQVFQRSFTTKGKGRGTGTYSIKLLGEKYLGGIVGFTSGDSDGTTFWIELSKE